ncbi:ABC transporter F family member 4-like isoform X2 [Periplaneta americana]
MHPAIWNCGSAEYMSRNLKEEGWNNIGEVMFPTWYELTDTERAEKGKLLKDKWRHIRDNYMKFINPETSPNANLKKKKKKYVYADSLCFLQHLVKKRRTRSVNQEKEEEEEEQQQQQEVNTSQKQVMVNSVAEKLSTSLKPAPRTRKYEDVRDFQKELVVKLNKQKPEDEDADRAFLLSLLPDYRKLNDDQKIDFRIHALQFFRDIRRGQNTKCNT